jgi:hypothetical protein
MKFYESHYEEYLDSLNKYNLHPELDKVTCKLPKQINQISNMIVYGPPGVGKYTQVLNILRRYSTTNLKYDKKITAQTEKVEYTYHISDIHYEVDMSLLGCNSKILWREIFSQIVDIVSVKNEKHGIIVCKNFHMIHTELLEVFYSYMQQCSSTHIHFILITEHLSFLPNNIIQSCQVINIARPSHEQYEMIARGFESNVITPINSNTFISRISKTHVSSNTSESNAKCIEIINKIDTNEIVNCKEIKSFSLVKADSPPIDIFNVICDKIIQDIKSTDKISFVNFRDSIYDMLVYNLDVTECIWYIIYHFIQNNSLSDEDTTSLLDRTYTFLKYYNNNYRPIYHLESILFYLIIKVHKL